MLRTVVLLFFLLANGSVKSQRFSAYQSVTTSNGLPSNYVFAVCEDSEGFLWAGTDKGLCRYNGFSWQVWDKDNGLPGNYINRIISDDRKGLWLSISDKGFYHFDIATGKVIPFLFPGMLTTQTIEADKQGNLFFLSYKGNAISGYVVAPTPGLPCTKVFTAIPHANTLIKAVPAQEIIYAVSNKKGSTALFDSYVGKWKTVEHRVTIPGSTLYYASLNALVTNTSLLLLHKDGSLRKEVKLFKEGNEYAFTTNSRDGYYVTDIKTGYHFIDNEGNRTFVNGTDGIGSDYINQVYKANDNTTIFATLGAGLQMLKSSYLQSASTNNKAVRSIVKANDRWLALTGNSMIEFSPADRVLKPLATVEPSALTMSVSGNNLVVGSLKGIQFYSLNDKDVTPKNFMPLSAGISSVYATSKDTYRAGSYGSGLILFTNKAIIERETAFPMKIIEDVIPLSFGFAALSYEDGVVLSHHNNQRIHLTQRSGLLSNSVFHLHELNDTLYIATKAGISLYAKGRIVKSLSTANGFAGTKAIYSFHDQHKRLWVVSDKYLHLLNGDRLQPISSHPLISSKEDLLTSALYDPVSHLLATGSLSAISLIDIDKLRTDTTRKTPRLLYTFVDGQKVAANASIPYLYKDLRFTCAPIASSPLSQEKIAYRITGSDWKFLQDSLVISFPKLRPGFYQLQAKIINADELESPVTTLSSFTIQKPFWQTLWFTVLSLIATIILTYFLFRLIEKAKRKKLEAKLHLQQLLQQERERISKDLHDHLGTNLVTMIAQVDSVETKLHRNAIAEASATVAHLGTQARDVMNVLRETIWAVQENEHQLGELIIRIRTFLQRLYEATAVSWHVTLKGDEAILLSPQQTLHLFRIVQEASQNILKHARATNVLYVFEQTSNHLQITITDDGIGMLSQAGDQSNGISNMRQRIAALNGSIAIDSASGKGTTIVVQLPV